MVEKLLEIYNNSEEVRKRVENGYNWIVNKMDWQKGIVPQWVKLFDKAYTDMRSKVSMPERSSTEHTIKAEVF